MTGFNKRVYAMLLRVVVFSKAYPHLLQRNPLVAQGMREIEGAVQRLSAHDASLAGGDVRVRVSSSDRTRARAGLREQLEAISRTARGQNLGEFSMPRGRSDGTLVSVAKLWADHAAPLKQTFIDSGLPADFIEKLHRAIEEVERTIHDQTHSNIRRESSTFGRILSAGNARIIQIGLKLYY